MSRIIDLKGIQFGKWTVLRLGEKAPSGNYRWLCRCSCGNEVAVDGNSLRSGRSTGCRKCAVPHNRTEYTGDPIQTIWAGMKQRCYDPAQRSYKNYGERGIGIYSEWLENPIKFYDWAYANGYKEGLSIDRIDNNKGYNPDNCRFIPLEKQSRNRRSNNMITIDGVERNLSEWCRVFDINRGTVRGRIKRGWDTETALKTKVNRTKE